MEKNIVDFLAKRAESRAAQAANSNLMVIGTFGEFIQHLGADSVSDIRQLEKNPYITLYAGGKVVDNVPFSNKLAAKHEAQAFELIDLLDLPVYGIDTLNAAKEEIQIVVIGTEQGAAREDIVAVAELFKTAGKTLPKANVAGNKSMAIK